MATPPKSFFHETGKPLPCGSTWSIPLTVTGQLPDGFGAAYKHTIQPVAKAVPMATTKDVTAAEEFRDVVQARINLVRERIAQWRQPGEAASSGGNGWTVLPEPPLSAKEGDALNWLLDRAEVELAKALEVHDDQLFPLDQPDTVVAYNKACQGRPGLATRVTNTGGRAILVVCPTVEEVMVGRPAARSAILQRFKNALMHVRCAEYWTWRYRLVAQALHVLEEAGKLPPRAAPEPPSLPGGSRARDRAEAGGEPPTLPGSTRARDYVEHLPDPDDLPDVHEADEVEDDDVGGPEGAGDDGPLDGPQELPPSRPSTGRAAALAVGGLALGALFWKLR